MPAIKPKTKIRYALNRLQWDRAYLGAMSDRTTIALLEQRRDDIRDWLSEEAPYAAFDQKHLDAQTPERAYWHHGYQSALADIIQLLNCADQISGSEDNRM
jgi:hypothetical protein